MITDVSGTRTMPANACAHAHQRVSADAAGDSRANRLMRTAAHRAAQHGADEEAGAEDAARVSGAVAGGGGDQFQHHQQRHYL